MDLINPVTTSLMAVALSWSGPEPEQTSGGGEEGMTCAEGLEARSSLVLRKPSSETLEDKTAELSCRTTQPVLLLFFA